MNSDCVYVVFGATGGIGRELCQRLTAKNAKVVACGRNPEKVNTLVREYGCLGVVGDAQLPGTVQEAFDRAQEIYGPVTGVTNLIGSILLKPVGLITDDEWQQTIAINLLTAFHVTRASVKAFGSAGGSIVLMSSAAAQIGLSNHEAIAAAKSGIEGLMRSAAASYANKNVRVNCVAPGLTRTPLTARITGNEMAMKASLGMHPLGRVGEPSDIAQAIEFLLDPANSWITAQVLAVDGGLGSLKTRAG